MVMRMMDWLSNGGLEMGWWWMEQLQELLMHSGMVLWERG